MMRKLKTKLKCQTVALACAVLLTQGVALATAPRSSGTIDITCDTSTAQSLNDSTASVARLSTDRSRSFSSSKYESSFVRNEALVYTTTSTDVDVANQTDGSMSLPQTETGTTGTFVGSMRDLWAGSHDGGLIYLTESTITQSGSGIALITAHTPLPGAVWLGLIGLGAIGITRNRKQAT